MTERSILVHSFQGEYWVIGMINKMNKNYKFRLDIDNKMNKILKFRLDGH